MSESNTQSKPEIGVERLYVKDISFESPQAPGVFAGAWEPQVKLDINTRFQQLEPNRHEVVLTITVNALQEEEKTAFIIEVQQAGIFHITGLEKDHLRRVLSAMCPGMLFPYARETIDSLAVRGGFPPLSLAPVNFDALYEQALTQQSAVQTEQSPEMH